jgi:two-component system phosphate regulon sensor histidine kinase PhoR
LIFVPFVVTVLVTMLVVALYVQSELDDYHREDTREQLLRDTGLAGLFPEVTEGPPPAVAPRLRQAAHLARARLTVIEPDGTVSFESHRPAEELKNHGDRPEVVAAFRGEVGTERRLSDSVNQEMMYVARPVMHEDRVVRVVRMSKPVLDAGVPTPRLLGSLAVAGAFLLMLSMLAAWLTMRNIVRPLEALHRGAESFSNGDLTGRVAVQGSREIRQLAEAMNSMAAGLQKRLQTTARQRSELEAVLSNMTEAILVLKGNGELIRANRAARRLLSIPAHVRVKHQKIQDLTSSPLLAELVAKALSSKGVFETELELSGRHLQVHANWFEEEEEDRRLLIALHDVTRLKKLETLRRDFVANVSHELKTPITSIQGFVETLREGALDDPENARQFLGIIARQGERLNRIVEDLLSLSRLEQFSDTDSILLSWERMSEVLAGAVLCCDQKARELGVTIDVICPEDLVARANGPLLEQAVVNLLDNAIKHSPSGGKVLLRAFERDSLLVVEVEDFGSGIPQDHLDRIFERFYRVDKARSRRAGGTGLGLAIVKHIVQSHNGTVEVASTEGKGSCFTIRIPM